ncbi:MAG: amino-acid N-acetyltransferase [Candidatus Azotimanducaceae bacterium]|jgi:amino-acid N-acetyltransferase
MTDNKPHVKWFRDSSPYINAHRGKTFVLHLGCDALRHGNFPNIVSDIVLLNSLGVRLVLAFGASTQIQDRLKKSGDREYAEFELGKSVLTPDQLPLAQEVIGRLKSELEARLSMGLINSPQHGSDLLVTSGNFIKAKPLGVIGGVDYHHTGSIRNVATRAIHQQLETSVVLIPPVGYSLSGEMFCMDSADMATTIAIELNADKLIFFTEKNGVIDQLGTAISELSIDQLNNPDFDQLTELQLAKTACQNGVSRCHLLSYQHDGALLEELYTRDGAGTQIIKESYEQVRQALAADIPGILELISPLEEKGVLVKRSRELLESEHHYFTVCERDGMIVGCAALYPFDSIGELACLATHPDYRDNSRGELLLAEIIALAKTKEIKTLFVLTTQTAHWFLERGFNAQSLEMLPESRKSLYNYQRNSKLLAMSLI